MLPSAVPCLSPGGAGHHEPSPSPCTRTQISCSGSLGAEATSLELTGHVGPRLAGPRPRREPTIGMNSIGHNCENGSCLFSPGPRAPGPHVQSCSPPLIPTRPSRGLKHTCAMDPASPQMPTGHLHWPSLGTEGGRRTGRSGPLSCSSKGGLGNMEGDRGTQGRNPRRAGVRPGQWSQGRGDAA